jgi:hypothetical protein
MLLTGSFTLFHPRPATSPQIAAHNPSASRLTCTTKTGCPIPKSDKASSSFAGRYGETSRLQHLRCNRRRRIMVEVDHGGILAGTLAVVSRQVSGLGRREVGCSAALRPVRRCRMNSA